MKNKKCPGSKIKSQGLGKGLGIGKTKGPIGKPSKNVRAGKRNK